MYHQTNEVAVPREWSAITPDQLQFWTAWSLFPERPVDVSCFRIEWRVDLDVAAFECALEALVAATDSLRLRFGMFGGQVLQTVDDEITAQLEIADFAMDPDPENAAIAWLDKTCEQPLDLRRRTYGTSLVRCGEDHWIWQLNQHHIASDQYSNWLLVDRLNRLYRHVLKTGQTPVPIYPSFPRFVEACPQPRLDRADTDNVADSDPLDICPVLERKKRKTVSGSTRMLRTDIQLDWQWTQDARHALGISAVGQDALFQKRMFEYTLSATVALCARLSGSAEVTVGVPNHNRYFAGSEDLTGLLMRVLPVQFNLENGMRMDDLRAHVADEARSILNKARNGERIAWRPYSVILNFLTTKLPDFAGAPTKEISKSRVADSVGLDMSVRVEIANPDEGIRISVDLNEDVARELGLEATAAAYVRSLDGLLKMPDTLLDCIPLAPNSAAQLARERVSASMTVPAPDYITFVDGFLARVQENPAAVALFDPIKSLTYSDLERQSRAVAVALRNKGIGQGDVVAICVPRSLNLVVAMLGVLRSGAAFSALETDLTDEWRASIVTTLRPALIIGDADAAQSGFPGGEVAEVETLISHEENLLDPLPRIQPGSPMYIMFSSGTTSTPKGIVVPHGSFARYLSWAHSVAGKERPWTWALASTASFEIAHRPFISLISGGAIAVYPTSGGIETWSLVDAITADQADFISLTPSQLSLLVRRKWAVKRLTALVVIGEKLSTELALCARDAFGPDVAIQNWYGPTETVMATAMHSFDPLTDKGVSVPVGRAAPDSTVNVLDAGLNLVPQGVLGEVFIGGNRMSLGYLNRPDLNKAAFVNDPFREGGKMFRTGDIGYFDAKGDLFIHGRSNDQIKFRGKRVDLAEIEMVVQRLPQVLNCAAIVSGAEDPRLICFYVAKSPISAAELHTEIAKYLSAPGAPSRFIALDRLPLTPNGKTDRRALEKAFRNAAEAPLTLQPDITKDFTETEAQLAEIWCGLLEIHTIGRFEGFFELGGDSLLVVRMLLETESRFDVQIPGSNLDQTTTIAELAALVDQLKTGPQKTLPSAPIVNLQPNAVPSTTDMNEVLRRFDMVTANWQGVRSGQHLPVFGFNLQGTLPPIFWCFNGVHEPVEMARELGQTHPVYALRSLNGIVSEKSLKIQLSDDVARLYADEIVRLQVQGPYFLGGNCQAGLIAEKTARILLARGLDVGQLCLLEHTPQRPYPGRLALFYGELSKSYNPFLKMAKPQHLWNHIHKHVSWDIVPGDHGQYFSLANLPHFIQKLRSRQTEAYRFD